MSEATHRAAVTERASRAGGIVAKKQFRTALDIDEKSSATDVVTNADREAQEQVLATIAGEFPGARVVCEEDQAAIAGVDVEILDSVPDSGDAWVVDPIDGTANYASEIRFWATSVAAISGGEPVAGATYLPSIGDIYTAGPESVSRNDEPMTVNDETDPDAFTVGLLGRWSPEESDRHGRFIRETTARFGDGRRFGSMQGVLALVAAGSLEAAIMPDPPEPWDSIAGVHLLRRAGGTATTVDGDRWRHDAGPLVVSNGECHDRVCEVARACIEAGEA
jgi:myo-inositol-1(or 4)-monophosphatase